MKHTAVLILITSFWTIGIFMATYEGEVLHGLKKSMKKVLGEYWAQPFISCPYCMPSFHGLLICATFHIYRYELYHVLPVWPWHFLQYLFIVVASSTVNYVLYNLIRILIGYAEVFQQDDTPCPEVSGIETKIKKEEGNG